MAAVSNAESCLQRVLACGLVPIVRGQFRTEELLSIAEAVAAQGISVLEITLNSAGALGAIGELRRRFSGQLLIGAGTVRTAEMFRQAREAGAQFTIAPNLDASTQAAAAKDDCLHLPGVMTPTEIQQAAVLGCKIVKLFPVDCFGPKYLRAVRAPLDDMLFLPTGGITLDNLADYVSAGAAAVGIGSALVTGSSQSKDELSTRAAAFRRAWDAALSEKSRKES